MAPPPMQLSRFDLEHAPLDEGTVLLEASAGTGKTYALTGILLRLLLEGQLQRLEQALVVTFTVAAADELKNRLRAGLVRALAACRGARTGEAFFDGLARHGASGAKVLQRALDEFDAVGVTTIHGFCKRLLDEAAFESREPFELELAADEAPLWHAAAADALRLVRANDSPMLGALLHAAGPDPDELVALYRAWRRHPDVALDPPEPQLQVHLANLRAAVHRAAALWDDALIDRIAALPWTKGKNPLRGDPRRHAAQQAELLATEPEFALSFLAALAPRRTDRALHKRGRPSLDHPWFAACDDVDAALQSARQHLRCALLLQLDARFAWHQRERALLTYQDLLVRAHRALADDERRPRLLAAIHARFAVALIDEFQDTDQLQYEIFSTCFRNRPLFLVGDPKQSIYAFRGADLRTYLAARQHAVQRATLDVNFRSSQQLVQAVGLLFGRAHAFVEPQIRLPTVRAAARAGDRQLDGDPGPALRFRLLPPAAGAKGPTSLRAEDARAAIARDLTAEICRLLGGGVRLDGRALLPRDMAVLTRKNVEAVLVQETLRQAGITAVIGRAGDVFETDELIELERLLLAILRPNDASRARAAMATRLWGHDAAALAALSGDDGRFDDALGQLERWRQLWLKSGFFVMKEQLLADLDADARLLQERGGERRLTNFQQLCEMLHAAEHEHRLSPEGLLHWLAHERAHKDEVDYQRRELRLESDEDAVQIMTMHGSKGLQYEVVFCPFLWDGRRAPRRNAVVDTGGGRRFAFELDDDDPGWLTSEADRLAEDVRLAYVAITRARRRCYLHWGPIGSAHGGHWCSALAWLLQPSAPDQSADRWQLAWAQATKDQPLDRLAAEAQALAARSHGTIGVEPVAAAAPAAPTEPAAPAARPGAPRARPATWSRELPRRWPRAVHSFSSLVAGAAPDGDAHDRRDPGDALAAAPGRGIFGFRRGAEAGQCLHALLETVDLRAVERGTDDDAIAQQVRIALEQHGLADPAAHPGELDPVAAVLQNLRDLAAAHAAPGGPTFAALCGGPRAAEWGFTLPVPDADPRALAALFAQADCPVAAAYAPRLTSLPARRLAGYLTGFADLVAEHDGRYWLLDWKSNHLGNALSDYAAPAIAAAMHAHDYVLQYHLYVLALHRHLAARLADYDYDRHFAGVAYVFLRGVVPGSEHAVHAARPPSTLIDALDRWAGAPGGGDR